MKNLYEFNKIVYKGNIDRDFYLFCCNKNKKLYLYIFIHLLFSFLGFISLKKELAKKQKYHKYLNKINNLDEIIIEFVKKNRKKISSWYIDNYSDKNVIFSSSPEIIVKPFLNKEKLIAPNFNKEYELVLSEQINNQNKINEQFKEAYYNNFDHIKTFKAKCVYVKKGNILINYVDKKIYSIFKIILKYILPLFLSLLLLLISFTFTTVYLDTVMINNYLEDAKLLLLNLIPLLLMIYIFLFLTKRMWLSFSITSLFVFLIGIINKTKLYYRDDVFKFEDITLFKEALIMTSRYDIIIRWYTIVLILLCIGIAIWLRKNIKKINLKKRITLPIAGILIIASYFTYQNVYTNEQIYDSVGNQENINIWIDTRQSQIRGLIYPFIYSNTEILDNKPSGYNEEEAKNIIDQYTYDNIPEDKKVNIIAIMLEAYNDFSKFDTIEFTNDIYENFHEIQNNSLHGEIIVNIFGGGTINTERKFITGYTNFPSFRKETNSYARYFKEQGYVVEAMHPIFGAFYNRNTVNINLGFDNYWNYENRFSEYNGWNSYASDQELYSEIIEDLEKFNNEGEYYFNFSVTYQNHGPYSASEINETYIENLGYSDNAYNMFNRYLSGIKSTNEALYELVNYIDNYEEPTILIFFGDHNPYLGEANYVYEELGINLDLTTTEGFENYYGIPYIIHANSEAKEVFNKDFAGELDTISPNFIMNELFEYIGYEGNEYLKYTNELKNHVSVINSIYYKEDNEYIPTESTKYTNLIDEFNKVSYYWANNLRVH